MAAYHRAFQDQQTHHFTVETAAILEGLAVIAAALHHFELAARLCGVAAAWRTTYDETYWFGSPDAFEKSADNIRRHLGDEAWLRAYAEGETATYGAATLWPRKPSRTSRQSFNACHQGSHHAKSTSCVWSPKA